MSDAIMILAERVAPEPFVDYRAWISTSHASVMMFSERIVQLARMPGSSLTESYAIEFSYSANDSIDASFSPAATVGWVVPEVLATLPSLQLPCLVFSSIASAFALYGILTTSVVIFGSGLALFATLGAALWESRR